LSSNKTDDNLTANTIIVDGIVQRVGFRRFVEKLARQNRIMGYAANRKDGTVTIFAQGESKENLEQFISQLKNAPSPILVERLDAKGARPRTSLKRFEIRVGSLADEMMEGFGAMETQFSDYREEFRDYRREFRGFAQQTENNFGAIDMKYGEISQKLTQILDELRTENREAISSLNKSVDALIQAVDKLSKN
jgi:acylphosphatase